MNIANAQRIASAIVGVSTFLASAGVARADTFYQWRDAAGRLTFSNRTERLPSQAQIVKLPELSVVTRASSPEGPSRYTDSGSQLVSSDHGMALPSQPSGCSAPDAGPLIDAITSRLESERTNVSPDSGLTLFVAATPVWDSNADQNMLLVPGGNQGETTASDQAAIAYVGEGGCPRLPPLDRYAVTTIERSGSSMCADYRRAAAEIDIAAARNETVARTFRFAAARFDSVGTDGEVSGVIPSGSDLVTDIRLPAWVVEAQVASTAELASEIDQYSEELAVARDEIDRAAHIHACW